MEHDELDTQPVIVQRPFTPGTLQAVVVGNGILRTYSLPASGDLNIGRLSRSQISIDDASISRLHAILHLGPPITIEDLGSANGTFIRGHAVRAGLCVEIPIGEPIRVGSVSIIIQPDPEK